MAATISRNRAQNRRVASDTLYVLGARAVQLGCGGGIRNIPRSKVISAGATWGYNDGSARGVRDVVANSCGQCRRKCRRGMTLRLFVPYYRPPPGVTPPCDWSTPRGLESIYTYPDIPRDEFAFFKGSQL